MSAKPTYEELQQRVLYLEKAERERKAREVRHRMHPMPARTQDDRPSTDKALQESEARHRLHFENVSDVIYTIDREFKLIDVSPSVENLLGYRPEELIGRPLQDLNVLSPDYLEQAFNDSMQVFEGKRIRATEYQFIARDGSKKWGEVSGAPLIRNGQVIALISVARDITDRKMAEEALRHSEEKYRTLFNQSVEGIYLHDLDGRILDVNQMACLQSGYTKEELLRRSVFDLHPGGTESMNLVKEEILRQWKQWKLEHRYTFWAEHQRKDGTVFPVEISTGIIRYGDENLVLAIVQDITERKGAEEALHLQNLILDGINRIFQQALVCETKEELGELCLEVAKEVTGSKTGFIGMNDKDREIEGLSGQTHTLTGGLFGRVLSDGRRFDANTPVSRQNGADPPEGLSAWRTILSVPLIHGNKTIGVLGLGNREDGYKKKHQKAVEAIAPAIVQALLHKMAQEALRKAHDDLETRVQERTAKLKKANKHIKDYAANLKKLNIELQEFTFAASHDLQEPLRKVQIFGKMLLDRYRSSLEEKGQDYLMRLTDAAERMSCLLRSLLEYSRISTPQNPFEQVELGKVIEEAISDLELTIAKSGANVRFDKMPVIEADPDQLRQLFGNLIGNAIKYGKEKERPHITISANVNKGSCRIHIHDNGIGFDELYVDRIFKPFQRLHGRTSAYEGTGMGLAICRKVVERHGGSITARSHPGQGATFIVDLPLKQK